MIMERHPRRARLDSGPTGQSLPVRLVRVGGKEMDEARVVWDTERIYFRQGR